MDRRGALPGERRGGRAKGTPNKRKSDKALVRLDEAESEVRAIRAEGFKIGKLGKDRLAEIDEWAFRLAKKFAPKENEKGQPFWESPGDEARFERYLKLSAECARGRAAYESPRYAAIAMAHQQQDDDDPFEGIDPHKHLEELVTRFFAAKAAEAAEKLIDVTSAKPEPDPAPIEPERGPEDGEAVWCSDNIDDPYCKHDEAESGDRPSRAVEAVQQNSKSYLDPDKIQSRRGSGAGENKPSGTHME